jgi:RecB family exonuclease
MTPAIAEPGNGHPPLPCELPAAEPKEMAELGMVLSPSQANTFIECPAEWYFKKLLGLPDPGNSGRSLGSAVHSGIATNMRQKILSRRDLAAADVVANFEHAWREKMGETEFREDEDPGEVQACGAALIEVYMRDAAPNIQPALVEWPVGGEIGGVQVCGYIDIVDVSGLIIDNKVPAARPNGVSQDHRLQLTTYDLLCPHSRGKVRVDNVVKTATVEYVPQSFEITPADVQYAETVYPMVQDAIRDGIFYPRRSSWHCSRKNCGFWRACEKQYGGEVKS